MSGITSPRPSPPHSVRSALVRAVHQSGTSGAAPLAAALIAFRDFESLRFDDIPPIRSLHLIDPVFGPLLFVGVLIGPAVVELAAFTEDPDYWRMIEDDPND